MDTTVAEHLMNRQHINMDFRLSGINEYVLLAPVPLPQVSLQICM